MYTLGPDNGVLLTDAISKIFHVPGHANVDLSPTGGLLAHEIELLDNIVSETHCIEERAGIRWDSYYATAKSETKRQVTSISGMCCESNRKRREVDSIISRQEAGSVLPDLILLPLLST
jgi:hypothetical protein